MVKVIYKGKISPCRVSVGGSNFDNLKRGDVLDVGQSIAERLLTNEYFSLVGEKDVVSKSGSVLASDDVFDLNNDNVFDLKDASIAGSVLSKSRKKKNKLEGD